jgi:hypothetical protein
MTPLAAEMLRILRAVAQHPPLSPASLRKVLHAIGYGPLPSEAGIVQALDALMTAGHVAAVHSARLGARYRVLQNGSSIRCDGAS